MHLIRAILLFVLIISSASAKRYWVFFKDDPARPPVQLTEQARIRMAQRGLSSAPGGRAVSELYLRILRDSGYHIRTISRFLNAVSLEVVDQEQLQQLKDLPFVTSVTAVASRVARTPVNPADMTRLARSSLTDYGPSLTQNEILDIPVIHDYGYDGSGVLIAVFDTGFNIDHPVFNRINIIDEYDFVEKDDDPYKHCPDDPDEYCPDEHGSQVLSAMAGYYPGELIGPAYGADFLLARTEDVSSETRVEEDNWVAAMEWADSLGADIISASLNYKDFDGTADDYPYESIDGKTAIVTRAANIAASRGILVINSMGNDGPANGSVWPPADSPHVLGVGAINAAGDIAGFSSRGPTYDRRTKPDVVAMGSSVYIIRSADAYRTGSGTSFATPQIAGLAALLLQSRPSLHPDTVITVFHENSDRSDQPDNTYGYGVPKLSGLFSLLNISTRGLIYPNPSTSGTVRMVISQPIATQAGQGKLFDIRGRFLGLLDVHAISDSAVELELPHAKPWENQLFIVTVEFGGKTYSGKFVYIKS